MEQQKVSSVSDLELGKQILLHQNKLAQVQQSLNSLLEEMNKRLKVIDDSKKELKENKAADAQL